MLKTKNIEKEISTDKKTVVKKKVYKWYSKESIIISSIILIVLGYIAFDVFIVNTKINDKVDVVKNKFDSLELYLNNKIPQIDNAIKIQEEQVNYLLDLSPLFD